VSLSDFLNGMQEVEGFFKQATGSVLSQLDKMTYGMLINTLKSGDAEAVRTALDQIAREKKPAGIPPVYLVSVAHSNPWVRQQALNALHKMAPEAEITRLTQGKDAKEATRALIEHYGHFRV
jgi:hypothetical protein